MRFFDTAGPCKLYVHDALPIAARLSRAQRLIDQQSCLVVYGPRGSGKTTAMRSKTWKGPNGR